MNQINPDDKELAKKVIHDTKDIEIHEENLENRITNKINLFSTADINAFIKNLSRPQFIGSIHLRKDTNLNKSPVNDMLKGELQMRLSKAIANPFNNVVTRYLVFLMILFNVMWILFFYIL